MKKHMNKDLSLARRLAIGTLISALSIVVTCLAFTVISSLTKDPTSLIGIFSLTTLLLGGALSGFIISRMRCGGSLTAIGSSGIIALLMLMIGFIIKGGMLSLSIFLNYLAYLGATALFSSKFLKIGKRKRRKF